MVDVLKRTCNSVQVKIEFCDSTDNSTWKTLTVGGSVIFKWKLTIKQNSMYADYVIGFNNKIPSENINYIVSYTHWKIMTEMNTAVMKVRSDHRAVYCVDTMYINSTRTVTVEISTDQLLSPYATIYEDAELTDFMLRGEDGTVPFHKAVIAAHSSVFKTMLAGEWKETSEGVIDVPGTSKEMLQHLKMYMYMGKFPEKQNERVDCLKQLLLLSLCYLIEDLTLRCIKELRFLLTEDNVLDMLQFAVENNIKQFLVEILELIAMGEIGMNELRRKLKNTTQPQSKQN